MKIKLNLVKITLQVLVFAFIQLKTRQF